MGNYGNYGTVREVMLKLHVNNEWECSYDWIALGNRLKCENKPNGKTITVMSPLSSRVVDSRVWNTKMFILITFDWKMRLP